MENQTLTIPIVFHYDPSDRFYISHEKADLCPRSGLPLLPAFATFQPPPATDVSQIKRFVDDIFMNEWLLLESQSSEFLEKRIIKLCAINEIDSLPKGNTKSRLEAIKNNDPLFFKTLIDLRNSFAHHLAVATSYQLVGADFPTVNTLYMKKGDLNYIELIEVYIEDLVKSFNRFVRERLSPQK